MAPPHNPSFILAFTDIKRGFKNSFIESLIASPPDSGGRAFFNFLPNWRRSKTTFNERSKTTF